MTQAKMAEALGIAVLTVIRYEGGGPISHPISLAVAHLLNTMPRLTTGDRHE